jgi:hypothetical protein
VSVLVVGDDRLRLERACDGLAGKGHRALALEPGAAVLGEAHARRPRAVVFDLGRRQPVVLELAAALAAEGLAGTNLVLAGVRDAAAARVAKKTVPEARAVLRVPPGDPKAVSEVARVASGRRGS